MKRKLLYILTLLLFGLQFFALPQAGAQAPIFNDSCDSSTSQSPVCSDDLGDNNISGQDGVLLRVVNILSFVVGVASVIMVILGGLKYITSNGDSNSISSAKNTILYALIGAAVFLFSQAIIIFVIRRL